MMVIEGFHSPSAKMWNTSSKIAVSCDVTSYCVDLMSASFSICKICHQYSRYLCAVVHGNVACSHHVMPHNFTSWLDFPKIKELSECLSRELSYECISKSPQSAINDVGLMRWIPCIPMVSGHSPGIVRSCPSGCVSLAMRLSPTPHSTSDWCLRFMACVERSFCACECDLRPLMNCLICRTGHT